EPLEVDDVDGAGSGEVGDDVVRPLVARIELEADLGVERAQLLDGALRDDERDGRGLAADGLRERAPRLAQRQVERGGLEAPLPIAGLRGDGRREGGQG